MNRALTVYFRRPVALAVLLLAWFSGTPGVQANPTGGTVAPSAATISTIGSQLTIHQTSPTAFINWQSFNIGAGETTTFVQPSSSSVAWNQINDANPSQILGNLNANGYVFLQNQNGFYVGGHASITAHGLIMTTAAIPAPDLSSGGPWSFNAPPPTAQIINYGQIKTTDGGSVFLIAGDIENRIGIDNQNNYGIGTISAPGGKIGLYAGQKVLVSMSPDGRGLSAEVTLPQGSVDNQGRLIADGGKIALQAAVVNQGGLIQANSVRDVNGIIELVASDNVSLDASSVISAQGGTTGTSAGGSVTIKSDHSFSDQKGSIIYISGGVQGGNGGQVSLCAPQMSSPQTAVVGTAASGFSGGTLTLDPYNIWLAAATTDPAAPSDYTVIDVNAYAGLSTISISADNNMVLNTLWNLSGSSGSSSLKLTAGNNLTVNDGSGIMADGWKLSLNANSVNQNGILQANSVGKANGVIEINAASSLTLGATSDIVANGDPNAAAASASPGGFVVLNAGNNNFSDTAGSTISVSGSGGGQNGIIEIFGNGVTVGGLNSTHGTPYALLVNPVDMTLSTAATSTGSNPTLNLTGLSRYSQIDLLASDNITLGSAWTTLTDPGAPATLSLSAGNNIIFNTTAGIKAPKDWSINLTAGTSLAPGTPPSHVSDGTLSDGIYLEGTAYLQTQNGNISLSAANEVQVGWSGLISGGANSGTGSVTTKAGGNISVTAEYGDVNTGGNYNGYIFNSPSLHVTQPYSVSTSLGGISTADGGDVAISAGNNVTSFLPLGQSSTALFDGGSGAFGPNPGNVTVTAGKNVYGHYVVADGTGKVSAGANVGVPVTDKIQTDGFALSLIDGSWSVKAPKGSIFLQEVRNPNGVFNSNSKAFNNISFYHLFDYDAADSVTLNAGNLVDITGYGLPRAQEAMSLPILLPGTLTVNSGAGGFELNQTVTLFPSTAGNLSIDTTGDFFSYQTPPTPNNPNPAINTFSLVMSDSAATQWTPNTGTYGIADHASVPLQQNSQTPVTITVGTPVNKANMDNVSVYAVKAAQVMVYGNMNNSSFVGENLQSSGIMSKTTITVGGQIYYTPSLNSVSLDASIKSANPLQPDLWDSFFYLAVTPGDETAITSFDALDPNVIGANGLASYLKSKEYLLFPNNLLANAYGENPGFYYNSDKNNLQLFFNGNMSTVLTPAQLTALEGGTFIVLKANSVGQPLIDPVTGHLSTLSYTFISPNIADATISELYAKSLLVPATPSPGLQIGGPGEFDITAGSMELGNAPGVLSWGYGDGTAANGGVNYASLESLTQVGAAVKVKSTGDLNMLTSTIASFDGGDVSVNSLAGGINLGTQNIFITSLTPSVAYGIYTSGFSDVTVTAAKDIDVNGSRIATYAGGTLTVQSSSGSVNIGDGGTAFVRIPIVGVPGVSYVKVYGSGIVAVSLPAASRPRGSPNRPGDIAITTLQGNINSTLAGILQIALDGNLAAGPKVTLIAGTTGVPATKNQGNIDLGNSGLIGGEVKLIATGDINGYIISRQNASINAGQNFNGTVLSTGNADVSAGGTVAGTIVGVGGVSASGSSVSASLLGQNVSVNGGTSQSTLGTTATATSASQSAAQQSSSETKQEVASDENDDQKNTKKGPVIRHVKRVTVLLPKPS